MWVPVAVPLTMVGGFVVYIGPTMLREKTIEVVVLCLRVGGSVHGLDVARVGIRERERRRSR